MNDVRHIALSPKFPHQPQNINIAKQSICLWQRGAWIIYSVSWDAFLYGEFYDFFRGEIGKMGVNYGDIVKKRTSSGMLLNEDAVSRVIRSWIPSGYPESLISFQ
jgi:hypothetical protein